MLLVWLCRISVAPTSGLGCKLHIILWTKVSFHYVAIEKANKDSVYVYTVCVGLCIYLCVCMFLCVCVYIVESAAREGVDGKSRSIILMKKCLIQ